MICVYPADCTDFSTNGNGTLAPLSAEVTETLNGEYELTLVHPIDEAGKWQRLVEGSIISVSSSNSFLRIGRISLRLYGSRLCSILLMGLVCLWLMNKPSIIDTTIVAEMPA